MNDEELERLEYLEDRLEKVIKIVAQLADTQERIARVFHKFTNSILEEQNERLDLN